MFKTRLCILCLAVFLINAANAQTMLDMDMSAKSTDTPATSEFKAGMAAMDKDMGHYTGDADRDFVVNMIPHHQGAIDMAKTELQYGSDPQLKTLAQDIIAAQNREIDFMNGWLAAHPEK